MMHWLTLLSDKRLGKETEHKDTGEHRTQFQRDFDRLIFSSAFRRMQNKTQVFPLPGSVFVHNRLTHSLEVSSVGRSLGTDVARVLAAKHPTLAHSERLQSIGAIVSAACLAHDMGNPPFGHSGERAISTFFSEGKGASLREKIDPNVWTDLTHFDGNANAFRLLTHQFNGHRKGGFVMTYATLAAIVKYPFSSAMAPKGKNKFGFFSAEADIYDRIADELGIPVVESKGAHKRRARHPLVYLVEAADDICYQIMDIEDAHKLRLLSDEETEKLLLAFLDARTQQYVRTAYPGVTDINDRIVYFRSIVINNLVQACVDCFCAHEDDILGGTFQGTLISNLPAYLLEAYQNCSKVAVEKIYRAKEVLDIDLAGYHIIYTLLDLMLDAVLAPEKAYSQLLLNQASSQYELRAPRLEDRLMAVLDYVSGMTDVFALDLFRKISGQSLPSV